MGLRIEQLFDLEAPLEEFHNCMRRPAGAECLSSGVELHTDV